MAQAINRVAATGLAVALLACASQAFGWGATGHRIIGMLGEQSLPADMPAFLHTPEAIEIVGEMAREPDRFKGSGLTHDKDHDPGHFTDVDDNGKVMGGPPLDALPPTREGFDTALRAISSDKYKAGSVTEYKAGYLPYSIVEGWQHLVKDFAYWRILTAAIPLEKNPDHKAWMQRDLKRRERTILNDIGDWAHFVGDGSQPMHVSEHFNGWGDFPNPNGYTLQPVHGPFEGAFVRQNVTEASVQAALPAPSPCKDMIEVCTAHYLEATEASVIPFYELEKAGGFKGPDPRGVAYANARVAAGAAELRDLTVKAWFASAHASAGYPAITVDQALAGGDAYTSLYAND
jgi:hypothetical protein